MPALAPELETTAGTSQAIIFFTYGIHGALAAGHLPGAACRHFRVHIRKAPHVLDLNELASAQAHTHGAGEFKRSVGAEPHISNGLGAAVRRP